MEEIDNEKKKLNNKVKQFKDSVSKTCSKLKLKLMNFGKNNKVKDKSNETEMQDCTRAELNEHKVYRNREQREKAFG